MSDDKFSRFREQYKTFTYEDYHITKNDKYITVSFDFKIDGLCEFHPETEIELTGLDILNDFSSPTAQNIVFSLGMVELISYWKTACPKTVVIKCGSLSDRQKEFWKQLYFGGLSEFFYINGIETNKDSFMTIECDEAADNIAPICYITAGINLIPVGGGKDSAVTAELLKPFGKKNKFFTVNDQPARTETVIAAGYGEDDIIRTYRTIDKNLLELNKKGFLNGHTPFSAIVAFLSLYCAYLTGGEYIVLSNESSANSGNIEGREVNHQYSSAKICFRAYAISAFYGRFRNCRLQNSSRFCRSITRFSAAATAAARRIYGAVSVPSAFSFIRYYRRFYIFRPLPTFSAARCCPTRA